MKTSPDSKAEILKAEYAKLSDDKLIFMATRERYDLQKLGYETLRNEIKRRRIFAEKDFDRTFSHKKIQQEEIDFYVEIIESLPCPRCGAEDSTLKSRSYRWAVSIFFYAEIEEKERIACKDCHRKWMLLSYAKTLGLGWWSIPRGVINTLKVLYQNYRSSQRPQLESKIGIERFIKNNIGHLRAYKSNKDKLVFILYRHND